MEFWLYVAAIAACVSFVILAIFAMVSLKSVSSFMGDASSTLVKLNKDINEIKSKVSTTLEDVSEIKVSATRTLDDLSSIKTQALVTMQDISELKEKAVETMGIADETIAEFKNTALTIEKQADNVTNIMKPFSDLSKYLYQKIAPPLTETASIVSATSKAISVFTSVLLKKRKGSGKE